MDSTKHTVFYVVLLTVAAAFIRIHGLGEWDYYLDEYWHTYIAQQPTLRDVFYEDILRDGHPVLPYFMWHWLLNLWNDPWMARLPALAGGVLCVPMGYLLGKEILGSRNGGLFAAFFMAFSSMLVIQSNVVRGYMPALLFCMLALWSAYRYARTQQIAYLPLYGVALTLSLLCEFAGLPIAVFMGLYLMYTLYKHPRTLPILLYVVIHLAVLAYLLWFKHMLEGATNEDFSTSSSFKLSDWRWDGFLHRLVFFLRAIYYADFTYSIMPLSVFPVINSTDALIFFLLTLAGTVYIVRHRLWLMGMLVICPVLSVVGLHYAGLIPMDTPRRTISIEIVIMVLAYYGCRYVLEHGLKGKVLRPRVGLTLGFCTALLCVAWVINGPIWRQYEFYEFQKRRTETQEILQYLDKELRPGDIIITDWLSSLFFWRNFGRCEFSMVSSDIKKYGCYKVPVYTMEDQYRNAILISTLDKVQRGVRALNHVHLLNPNGRVWFVAIQHVNIGSNYLNPNLTKSYYGLLDDPLLPHAGELAQMLKEQDHFVDYLFSNADPLLVRYEDSCTSPPPRLQDHSRCLFKLVIAALPMRDIHALFIEPADYIEVVPFLRKLAKARGH